MARTRRRICPEAEELSGRARRDARAGSVTVEMAIVAPILILLLFGIIEMGLLFRNYLVLGTACREAGRVAGLGKGTSTITAQAKNSAPSLNPDLITVALTYSVGGGSFVSLGNTPEGSNNAPAGSQIKVALSYPHTFIAPLVTHNGVNTMTLHATAVVVRE
jgi:Flp pilus assembly protein TadG